MPPSPARSVARALAAIEIRLGPGVVRRLRDLPPRDPADRARPSGSLGLDRAIGTGGYPRGGVTELLGPESSGKTALLYAALAACGVDVADLLLARPASAPDALLLLTILARCRALDALGLVSVPALRDLWSCLTSADI